jgi:hypothetical protein
LAHSRFPDEKSFLRTQRWPLSSNPKSETRFEHLIIEILSLVSGFGFRASDLKTDTSAQGALLRFQEDPLLATPF